MYKLCTFGIVALGMVLVSDVAFAARGWSGGGCANGQCGSAEVQYAPSYAEVEAPAGAPAAQAAATAQPAAPKAAEVTVATKQAPGAPVEMNLATSSTTATSRPQPTASRMAPGRMWRWRRG